MTIAISSISIRGIKGVYDRAGDFLLPLKKGKPQSIAVFGRNAHGKSGYADAIEYLFSSDGGIEHLGKGSSDSEQGGKHAIPHVLCKERNESSWVEVEFVDLETKKKTVVAREVVTGRNDPLPVDLEGIVARAPAHRILRQHDLRRFIVDMGPGDKFSEFARWIGFDEITTLLGHLTAAERVLKETDVDREINERLKDIKTNTAERVTTYEESAIRRWSWEQIHRHVSKHKYPNYDEREFDLDKAIDNLNTEREQILLNSPAAEAHANSKAVENDAIALVAEDGVINRLRHSFESALRAETKVTEFRQRVRDNVFYDVWKHACATIESQRPEMCPVCNTPWHETSAGSPQDAVVILRENLHSLGELKQEEDEFHKKKAKFLKDLDTLRSSLFKIAETSRRLGFLTIAENCAELAIFCDKIKADDAHLHESEAKLRQLIADSADIGLEEVPRSLSEHILVGTPKKAQEIDKSISSLKAVHAALERLKILRSQQASIRSTEQNFLTIANLVRSHAEAVAENAVSLLRDDVQMIYKTVHPGQAVPQVFVELDASRRTLKIRVNFHSTERRVPPGGYLSEAQINTLGLALFLSSVRLFNAEFPFVFLDDIVSSYDADCRSRIVDVLAEYMEGFQIFLTTHDERFYTQLKERLQGCAWKFERIAGYDFEHGPKRESDSLGVSQVDDLLKDGSAKTAGNAVRQYIEEWLDSMCEKYQAYTLHKREVKEFQRTLFHFWGPFVKRLETLGSKGSTILRSTTFERLKTHHLINYYSHHQANPYEWPAMGDVQYLWQEFQDFMKFFNCAGCGKLLKYDPSDTKLYCTCGGAITAQAPVDESGR